MSEINENERDLTPVERIDFSIRPSSGGYNAVLFETQASQTQIPNGLLTFTSINELEAFSRIVTQKGCRYYFDQNSKYFFSVGLRPGQ
jgi:hypothetical protein